MPGLKKKMSRLRAIPSAEIPANTLVTASSTNIATPRSSEVTIAAVVPSEPDEGHDFQLSPLLVIKLTLITTSIIFNLLQSTV